uniref:hypothetical protein n=1 Tax=Candidatus Electronema sp. TaxID=2698783 RepID=UPI004057726A
MAAFQLDILYSCKFCAKTALFYNSLTFPEQTDAAQLPRLGWTLQKESPPPFQGKKPWRSRHAKEVAFQVVALHYAAHGAISFPE